MIQRGLEFGDSPDYEILAGDCREVMATFEAESVDSIVSDPPYGLSAAKNSGKSSRGGFMGKKWDHGVPGVEFWTEALRVAKPGAHLLAFGGTRTYHRLACAIEDAGWEIRDCVMWVYGSGFPKSHDVSKAIDKAAGAEREVVGYNEKVNIYSDRHAFRARQVGDPYGKSPITSAATPEAKQWAGWGTSLKPAHEPVIVARKKLIGTVAQNVLRHGTGGLNIDSCRIPSGDAERTGCTDRSDCTQTAYGTGWQKSGTTPPAGRWPANVIHDGSDEVVGLFPQTGLSKGVAQFKTHTTYQWSKSHADATVEPQSGTEIGYGDTGSAARFFYCAKASKADRDEGCEGLGSRFAPTMGNGIGDKEHDPDTATPKRNHHPTVKPTALMRYLCRLVTPPGGVVLDPFMGSGSTGKAAMLEGFRFIGIEREAEYVEIARARIGAV
jgi:DNA modification methylase